MPEPITIIPIGISAVALIISYLSYRDKKDGKDDQELDTIKSDIAQVKQCQAVLTERVNNEIHQSSTNLNKLSDKLDKLRELL